MKAYFAGLATPFVAIGGLVWLVWRWHARYCESATCREKRARKQAA